MPRRHASLRRAAVLAVALAACSGGGSKPGGNGAPARVTGVTAVAGDGEVTISWNAVAGAVSYDLYWSTARGVTPENGDVVEDVASPQVLTVANDVTFYVVITALTADGETEPSAEISFRASATDPGSEPPAGGNVGVVTTIAGTGGMGYADGDGVHAEFMQPTGIVAVGRALYVCDTANMLIRAVDVDTHVVSTYAGYPSTYAGWADGVGTAAGFNAPRAIATDGSRLFVADTANNLLRRIDLATAQVTTIAGSRSSAGATDGPGASATFRWPRGVATDGTTLWIADTGNNAIRALDLATGAVSTLAGDPSAYAGFTDGVGKAARFSAPMGLALWDGWLLVADNGNSAIRAVDVATGEVVTASTDTGSPFGLAVIGDRVYVSNMEPGGGGDPVPGTGNTITEIDLVTGDAWALAGGNWYAQLADGTGKQAALNAPAGLAVVGGALYLADSLNHAIRRIDLQPL